MADFNRMTIAAACSVLGEMTSHGDMSMLEAEWGLSGRCATNSKSQRSADLANITLNENPSVITENSEVPLCRAIVELAIHAPPSVRIKRDWKKFISGLRLDGFEIVEVTKTEPARRPWQEETSTVEFALRRMYPGDLPDLKFREAENEIELLLKQFGFQTTLGHLRQAIDCFARGEWAAANGQLRTFYESNLLEIATELGNSGPTDAVGIRKFLGECSPPFLLSEFNEWHANPQKPQYTAGLMARLHPQGSHPGLSEEDDCAFRLQISLVTARLLLKRFAKRIS